MIVNVSDHALVRFLERAGGFDVETLRETIGLSLSRAAEAARAIGAAEYAIHADGLTYILNRGVVVTVLRDDAGARFERLRR
jgi:hypothetical protein